MSESNNFCIICGKHLSESHSGDICSDNCNDLFNNFKKDSNLISINGFCNFCGEFHELNKNSAYGVILHKHNKCYHVNSYFSKSPLQIARERDEKRRDLLLSKKMVYDYFSQYVICLFCNTYSVNYSEKWLCNKCNRNIVMKNNNLNNSIGSTDVSIIPLDFNLTKKDKFDIYKHHGIEALVKLTGESQYEISDFIRLYEIEEEGLRRKVEQEEELRRKVEQEELRRKAEQEKRRKLLLSDKKVYNSESNFLFCPYCGNYSVEYFNNANTWICDKCNKHIVMQNSSSPFPFVFGIYSSSEFNFTNEDKYKIYKCYGIESLVELTGDSPNKIKELIGSYFEKGCTSIGDNCLYYGHFKEANAAKQIGSIDNLFEKSKRDCNSLRNEIYNFLDSIEDVQSYLSEAKQKLLDIEYVSIKQIIEAIYEQIEDYLVAVANTDIKKGEKVYLRENEENLLADIVGESFDGFCWNYAEKGDFVGVCTVPSYALNQTKQLFEDFKILFEESNDVMIFGKKLNELDLSFLESETISIIIQNDGILQSQLWRELDIDSRKCSRIVTSLFNKGLISKDSDVYNGARTYRLNIKF